MQEVLNGGKNFEWITVKGYEKRDFRDIEAFDANTAVIMAVDVPAMILKTKDGGKTWTEVFHNDTKGMFLDAMDFTNDGNGMVVGDPIDNRLFIATTNNYGDKWLALKPENNFYTADTGEAFFAASGTNVKITGNKYNPVIGFVTGGTDSRLIFKGLPFALNIIHGKDSQGANSIAINFTVSKIAIVGGDFNMPASSEKNIKLFTIHNGNLYFRLYKHRRMVTEVVLHLLQMIRLFVAALTGVDISNDGGINWKLISNESFNVCAKAKKGNAVFLAGKDGRIGRLVKE